MDNLARLLILFFIEILIVSKNGCSGTISCFVCSSRNGSYTECEDPFNAGVTTYIERCKVPKRGHIGEFPAHFCIKIIGTSYATSEKIVIRRCVSETMDTQCGKFRFGDDLLRGCILTCDLDGCNDAPRVRQSSSLLLICGIAALLSLLLHVNFNQVNTSPQPQSPIHMAMSNQPQRKADPDPDAHTATGIIEPQNQNKLKFISASPLMSSMLSSSLTISTTLVSQVSSMSIMTPGNNFQRPTQTQTLCH